MREIKFRGRRIDNGEWVYGLLGRGNGAENKFRYILSNGLPGHWHRVVPESVGEFTGLHDKNGKEIYEGDILRFDDEPEIVTYESKHGRFVFVDIDGDMVDELAGYEGCGKIIGNIHEEN